MIELVSHHMRSEIELYLYLLMEGVILDQFDMFRSEIDTKSVWSDYWKLGALKCSLGSIARSLYLIELLMYYLCVPRKAHDSEKYCQCCLLLE